MREKRTKVNSRWNRRGRGTENRNYKEKNGYEGLRGKRKM